MPAAPAPTRASLADLATTLLARARTPHASPLLQALRATAQNALDGGFDWPTTKAEAFRHTSLTALSGASWQAAPAGPVDVAALQRQLAALPATGARAVFVNGVHHAGLSHGMQPDPDRAAQQPGGAPHAAAGLTLTVVSGQRAHAAADAGTDAAQHADATPQALGSLALHRADAFAALNTAVVDEVAYVHVAAGAHVQTPVQLVYVTTQAANQAVVQPRVLVVAERGATASVCEIHLGCAATPAHGSWTNAVTELVLGDNAQLDYAALQHTGAACAYLATVGADVGRDARLGLYTFDDGGKLARRAVTVRLQAANAEAKLGHVALARAGQHQATQATVQHVAGHTRSHQVFKAAVAGRGSAAFGGLVDILPNAPQVAAEQLSRALLLEGNAQAYLQPQLQILTDDVKCAHGATVGELNKEALFYLMSRGVAEAEARQLLTFAFLNDALDAAPAALRPAFVARAAHWLGMDAEVGRAPTATVAAAPTPDATER